MKNEFLNEVAEIRVGNSAPQGKEPFNNGEYNFYRTFDVGQVKQGEISESRDKVNKETYSNLKTFQINTILFPKSGESTFNNNRVIIKEEGAVASHLAGIKANPKFLNDYYLYYFLLTVDAKDLVQDSAYPSVNLKQISQIKIPVPSLQEQEKIVERLDKVFENIENKVEKENYKINLYDKLYKSKLNQIFSNLFKKSGETELNKLSEIISGQSPKGEFINNSEGLEFHQGKKAFSDKFLLDSGKRTKHTTKQIPKNTIVMSVRAPVGPVNISQNSICIGRGLAGIIPKGSNLDYLFYYLDFIKEDNTGHVGATINSINRNEIMNIKIPNLNIEKQEEISNKIKEIIELKKELASNSKKTLVMLNQLKQSMLSKEFSYE